MTSLLLVGCGKMGSALLAGWQESLAKGSTLRVIEPAPKRRLANVEYVNDPAALPASYKPDVIIFAVKPQQLEEILPAYRKRFGATPLYMSVAAGKTTDFFRAHLGKDIRIIRTMPNTPALVGDGMTVLYGDGVSPADKKTAAGLMSAVGMVEWIEDEALMDGITALSGSGPAYVFLFIESLVKGGVAAGLPESMAEMLAIETILGSCALAAERPESFEQLRKNVTSPGGTTEAALRILLKDNVFETLIRDAVVAAAKRSRELA